MDFIKKLLQSIWKLTNLVIQALVKLVKWWLNKIKASSNRKVAIAWLLGGLMSICLLYSFLFSLTPSGRESAAESRITRTAVAIAEATNERATLDAPTHTPQPTTVSVPTKTETPHSTATQLPREIIPSTLESSLPSPDSRSASLQIPLTPIITVKATRINVRSGPSIDYPVIQILEKDATAIATGFNLEQSWVQIELPDGTLGWVGGDLVDIEGADKLVTITNISPAPTAYVQQPPVADKDGSSSGNTDNPFQCIGGCASPPDPSCAIKGNVNSDGEKIYHVPWGAYYDNTDIKPEEGDRWFCTEAEAKEAGFRRSSR